MEVTARQADIGLAWQDCIIRDYHREDLFGKSGVGEGVEGGYPDFNACIYGNNCYLNGAKNECHRFSLDHEKGKLILKLSYTF